MSAIIDFTNVLLAALLVGALFGVWLLFNPAGLDASRYIALQQQGTRALHPALPALGIATMLVTVIAAVLGRDDRTRLGLLIAAVVCFVAVGVIARFLNQPINGMLNTWSSDAPPVDWTRLRDDWWRWHLVRLVSGLGGLALLVAATLKRGGIG
jgi:uncharacterized membrane protein